MVERAVIGVPIEDPLRVRRRLLSHIGVDRRNDNIIAPLEDCCRLAESLQMRLHALHADNIVFVGYAVALGGAFSDLGTQSV